MATTVDARKGSVLFTDLVGFTEYNDAVGDADALALLDRQTAIACQVLEPLRDARIVKELGDGLMVWFGYDGEGLAGASALMTAVADARAEGSFPLAVRMGLHHGRAIARGDDLVGQTVNIASRVASLAGPGELLVSDAVLAAEADAIDAVVLEAVGPVTVKGIHEPIWLHRVVTDQPTRRPVDTAASLP